MLAVSDAGCAALFCKAALQASALNVAINTKLMTDRAHAAALDENAARMLAEYLPLADVVYQPWQAACGPDTEKGNVYVYHLKGAPVVAAMNEANAARCAALREKGVVPMLAVVR